MQYLKKYAAILVLLLSFLLVRYVAENFILQSNDEIYNYIPQDADIIVEINSKNFIKELLDQRVFNEHYFQNRVTPSESEQELGEAYSNSGLNIFSKIVVFREAWALQNIWIGIFEYKNKSKFENFLDRYFPGRQVVFANSHAIVQITTIEGDDFNIDEHLEALKNNSIKNIVDRIDLPTYFKNENEINLYISPKVNEKNPIDEGFFAVNFLKNEISLTGELTKSADAYFFPYINYGINDTVAFSLRSSLNTVNGLNFLNIADGGDLPTYDQLAVDYNGVKIDLRDRNTGLPFTTHPQLKIQVDFSNEQVWQSYIEDLQVQKLLLVDPEKNRMSTAVGAELNYLINPRELRLSNLHLDSTFIKTDTNKTYIALNIDIEKLLKQTSFGVDEEHPPSKLESTFGLAFATDMLGNIYKSINLSGVNFELRQKDDLIIDANGKISLTNTNGNSIIESIYFMQLSQEMFTGF